MIYKEPKKVLSSKDLAQYLKISESTLRKMIKTPGLLPDAIIVGKCRRWRIEKIDAWLKSLETSEPANL